jgi:hypothetical protein
MAHLVETMAFVGQTLGMDSAINSHQINRSLGTAGRHGLAD